MNHKDAKELELEVLRLADALWGSQAGAAQAETIEGRERDCIYRLEDVTHYVECTTSLSPKKIEEDGKKMVKFRESEIKKGNIVKLWIVTANTPGSDQVAAAREKYITILSLDNFRNRLLNSDSYLRCREKYKWGSATNPSDDDVDISRLKYQNTDLNDMKKCQRIGINALVDSLLSKSVVAVLGDYGMGKSMLVREVYNRINTRRRKDSQAPVPIAINLRDHWGQTDPHEVLTRHANKIGFEESAKLVRAYNAGTIVLLVDGFDEIVGTPVASKRQLKKLRFEALTVVRKFVSDLRGRTGILVTGRQNFFDSDDERTEALGLRTNDDLIELTEFSSDEAERLLESFHIKGRVPSWLPRRPLFLAYLASQGLLSNLETSSDLSAAQAWHKLIDAICQREKRINEHLEASAIRNILSRLADIARETPSGRGPLNPSHIVQAYSDVTGYDEPDEHIRPLLMRLPGLTSRSSEDGSREFIDDSMLNALRSSALESFFNNPFDRDPNGRNWRHGISSLGIEVAMHTIGLGSGGAAKSLVAARQAIGKWESPTLAADFVRLGQSFVSDDTRLDCQLQICGGVFEELDLSDASCSNLVISGSEIGLLVVPPEHPAGCMITDSVIDKILGVAKRENVPSWIIKCEIGEFDLLPTNDSILDDADLPVAHRVLLTILRKLFLQRGAGRRENALSRGLPTGFKLLTPDILEILRSLEFVSRQVIAGYRVWRPDRSRTSEVHSILNQYSASRHPVVTAVRKIQAVGNR